MPAVILLITALWKPLISTLLSTNSLATFVDFSFPGKGQKEFAGERMATPFYSADLDGF